MTSTAPLRLLSRIALVGALVLAMASGAGCLTACDVRASAEQLDGGDANTPPPAIATPGCPADAVETQNGGACATCVRADGDVRICGEPETARCNNQENAFGERCQRCATDAGDVLYDDCAVSAEDVGATRCEVTPGDPTQGSDSECAVCFDDNGAVVSQRCEPLHDTCTQVVDGGRTCRECTRDGAVVIYQCDDVDLDPSVCEAYENELGRCIDCYGEDNALILHQCQLFDDQPFVSCVETIDPSGVSCVTCVDQTGNVLDAGCSTAIPEARACQVLAYETQSCLVCIDETGVPVLAECTSTCANEDPSTCPDLSQCYFERDADNQLCRTCFSADASTTETRCLTSPDLICTAVAVDDLPPDPNAPQDGNGEGGAAPPPTEPVDTCLFCIDAQSGAEVLRNCDGSRPQPPVCVDTTDETGAVCTVCSDGVGGDALYATCDGGETCWATGERPLEDAAGAALVTDGQTAAIAACYRCGSEGADSALTESDFGAVCAVPAACASPGGFFEPATACPTLTSLLIAPRQCDNGWDAWQAAPSSEAELLAVLGWGLDVHGLAFGSVSAVNTPLANLACAEACGVCPRGDVLEVRVPELELEAARAALAASLLPCEANADCPASGVCVDGTCGL